MVDGVERVVDYEGQDFWCYFLPSELLSEVVGLRECVWCGVVVL